MQIKIPVRLGALIPALTLLLFSCQPSQEDIARREQEVVDSVAQVFHEKVLQDAAARAKEAAAKYDQLVAAGDSLFRLEAYGEARSLYEAALPLAAAGSSTGALNGKIAATDKAKAAADSLIAATEASLLGKRVFGQQFITGYGTATITRAGEDLRISGAQYAEDKTAYTKLAGALTVLDDRTLRFTGNIRLYTRGCCGPIDQTGTFTFFKSGKRTYWRLQEFDRLCSQYTCAYYIDIFE